MQVGVAAGLPPVTFFRGVARRLVASPLVVDTEGKSLDDYQQDLVEFALRTFGGKQVDLALVRVSVKRRAIQAARQRARRASLRERFLPSPDDAAVAASARAVRDLESRSCVSLLETRMSARGKAVLGAYSAFGLKGGAAHTGMSPSTFLRGVHVARVEAQALLGAEEKQMDTDPTKAPDDKLRELYSCYGSMYSKDEAQCASCVVRDRCIALVVTDAIPKLRAQGQQTVEHLAAGLETDQGTVTDVLFQIEKGKAISALLPPQASGQTGLVTTAKVEKAAKAAKKKAAPQMTEVVETAKAAVQDALAEEKAASTSSEVTVSLESATNTQVAPKKKAKKGSNTHTEEAQKGSATDGPKEEPVKAKKKVVAKKPKGSMVRAQPKEVKARVDKTKAPKFDEGAFTAAWESERQRSPAVATLTPGTKLTKVYCGLNVDVTYRKGYVEWDGEKWPTLSAVKTAVVGKKAYPAQHGNGGTRQMTNWSVPRFFQIGATKKPIKVAKKAPTATTVPPAAAVVEAKAPPTVPAKSTPAKKKAAPKVTKLPAKAKKAAKKKAPATKKTAAKKKKAA